MTWDTSLYLAAHDQVIESQHCWVDGDTTDSIYHSLNARLAYVANLIVNVVSFPLAIIFVTFGSIIAISHWNFKIEIYTKSFNWIKTKTNHVLLSALGTAFPSLAYRYRDANLAPYVIALRIAFVTWGFFWAFSRR